MASFMARAILDCPDVHELYADNDRLKELVTDLPAAVLPR